MNYSEIKKLDEDTLKNLKEGNGPVDECLCSLLAPPYEPKGLRGSIRRAFASIGALGGKKGAAGKSLEGNSIEIPLTFTKGGKGIYTTKEAVRRTSSCGNCGCDNENFVLKHSYANIRITSPDVSSICPCSSACLPGKDKLNNNITVTIEHVTLSDNDREEMKEVDIKEDLLTDKTKPIDGYTKRFVEDVLPNEKTKEDYSSKHVDWKKWEEEEEWNKFIEEDVFKDDIQENDNLPEKESINKTEEHEKQGNTEQLDK